MKVWGELSFAQIGEVLGVSLNTAARDTATPWSDCASC